MEPEVCPVAHDLWASLSTEPELWKGLHHSQGRAMGVGTTAIPFHCEHRLRPPRITATWLRASL